MKRLALILFIIVIAIFTLTACTDTNNKSELEIKLDDYEFELDGKEVSEDFSLPNELFGYSVSWTSDNDAVDITEGEGGFFAKVTKPEYGENQISVKLTLNVENLYKDFTITVKPCTELESKLMDYKFELDGKEVYEDFTLPGELFGRPATWTSDNEAIEVIESDGIITANVNRPEVATENVSVVLTLHVLKENADYTVYVKPIKVGNPEINHTIVFYSSQGNALASITEVAIASFEKKYPGWKVQHIQVGSYNNVRDRIISDLQNGEQPDIAYCYSDHVAMYLSSGKVVDLNQLINSSEANVGYTDEVSDFVEGFYNEGLATNFGDYDKYGYSSNSLLSLPFVKSTELMYYNKTALDSLGLKPAQTWDELWEQCALIKIKYPTATPLGYDSESNFFITMCQQNGWGYTSASKPHFLFNNPQTTAWLSQLHEYYEKGYFITQESYGSYTSALFTKGVEDGGLVYCIGSSGGASHQDPGNKFEWGIAPILGSKLSDGTINYSAISQGPSFVMLEPGYDVTNGDEKKKMTFLFMKEMLDPTFQAAFAISSGYNPSRRSAYENPYYIERLKETDIMAVAQRVSSNMLDRMFTTPAFIGSSDARTQVGNALLYAMDGRKSPERALSDALSSCETSEKSTESESLLLKENIYGLYSFRSNKQSAL